MTLFIMLTVLMTVYALLLAGLTLQGKIVRQGWIAVGMTVVVILVALLTRREEAFVLAVFPAMLAMILCREERYNRGRRLKPEDKTEPEQQPDEEQKEES